jgi:hypothetical protein
MTEEYTVLDYFKAKLTPWRGQAPRIPPTQESPEPVDLDNKLPIYEDVEGETSFPLTAKKISTGIALPWFTIGALLLALTAQLSLEPSPARNWIPGAALYTIAVAALVVAIWRGEWSLKRIPEAEKRIEPFSINLTSLWIGVVLGLASFWLMGNNQFHTLNTTLWFGSIFFVARAFWIPDGRFDWFYRLYSALFHSRWNFSVSKTSLLIFGAVLLVGFFRLHQLNQVPPQMISDHAEKLLDVWDILHGETRIFFPRNTGREPLQMYMTAAAVLFLGTDYSFLSLKIGTVLAGLLTLPFIYLLGKEIGGKQVALIAFLFAGIAYWPNVVARMGLRYPLYPLFVAPTLYFLIRGIRRSSRNDFILAGLSLGFGLHGYTAIRILPIVVVLAVIVYLIHKHSAGLRRQTIWSLVVLAFISLMVFIPLLRYTYSDPTMFGYRALTRLGSLERPLPGPPAEIFMKNLARGSLMFSWDNGHIWPISVTHRPALDVISAGLFHLGLAFLLIRYIRHRHWLDMFLLVSIPLLLLPSILSLAFPDENPALNRASGAVVPVFLVVAIGLERIMSAMKNRLGGNRGVIASWGLLAVLLLISAFQNYDLVFNQYRRAYELNSWNTSELGAVIRNYAGTFGSYENAYLVAYPHWVDSRLLGVHTGNPTRDFAIFPEHLADVTSVPGPKLFLLNINDSTSVEALMELFPHGWLTLYESQFENKDFLLYMVPPDYDTFISGQGE